MSWQNFLFHGKTYFLTAKRSLSRQNFVTDRKTFKGNRNGGENVSKMATRDDHNLDDWNSNLETGNMSVSSTKSRMPQHTEDEN